MQSSYNRRSIGLFALYGIGILLILPCSIFGFGKNKVQYSRLTWSYLSAPRYDIYYHQETGDLPPICYQWVHNAYGDLSKRFQFTHRDRIPIIIYGSPNLFEQTNIITEIIPEGVGGFTELFKNRVAVPFNGSYDDLRHVLHHELVHAFMFGFLYEQFGSNLFMNTGIQVPLWFMEGAAEYLSSEWNIEADMFLMDKAVNGSIPLPGPELGGYMAYKGGQSFLFYLASSRTDSAFTAFLREFKKTKTVEGALKKIYGKTAEELGKEWIQELKRIYWPEIGRRNDPAQSGRAITSHIETRDHFNLRPRISPDGSKIAFFSDRRDYTRIIITDRKGKVIHEISQNGYGGFFESFHPFRSGICWSPDSKRLAFVTKAEGVDEIRIVNVERRRREQILKTNLISIVSPDWSRNGKKIVFSGIRHGKSDLYLYDLESDSLTQLTANPQLESDPRFSPDGMSVIFALQDTSGSALNSSSPYGNLPSNLFSISIAEKSIRALTVTPWNEKSPCYSPDGSQVLFVSDRNGIDNLYIGAVDSLDDARPLTDYIGGCSSPDWSTDGASVVFSLFQKQGWDIWLMEKPIEKLISDSLAYTRWVETRLDSSRHLFTHALLPKDSTRHHKSDTLKNNRQKTDVVEDTIEISEEITVSRAAQDSISGSPAKPAMESPSGDLAEPAAALSQSTDSATMDSASLAIGNEPKDSTFGDTASPEPDSIETIPDKQSSGAVQHDSAAQASIALPEKRSPYRLRFSPDMVALGLGVNTYYGYAGQWLLAFSDILGDHRITLSGDVQGNFKDYLHLYGSYLYLRERLDIGIGAYYSKDYTYASAYGDKIFHDTDIGGFLVASYPFSLISRLDFHLFGRQIRREPVRFDTTDIISKAFLPSISYAFDNILWGLTGPLNGIRASATARVSPPFSFIDDQFYSIDGDFRSYFHLAKRFVWANRIVLGGSFALGSEPSARRYFLGGNDNWLFYNVNVPEYEQNIGYTLYSDFVMPFRGWSYFDRSGTRVAVVNSEFRFPFIREVSVVWPIPMQIRYISGAFFIDAGNTWDRADQKSEDIPVPDEILGGIGFGLRANLGIFVLRFDRAWPTDWSQATGAPVNYFSLGAEF